MLAAKITNHVVEAMTLTDSAVAQQVERASQLVAAVPAASPRSKSGEPLTKRNMFCADCVAPQEVAIVSGAPSNSIPLTSLPLRLVATSVARQPTYSYATIRSTKSRHQGAFGVDERIPQAGPLLKISGTYIHFRNDAANRVERLSLVDRFDAKADRGSGSKPMDTQGGGQGGRGVEKLSANRYQVDRGLIERVMDNPIKSLGRARVRPAMVGGELIGMRVYSVLPTSLLSKLGIRNGDVIRAVNGFELTSMSKGFEIFSKLKNASNLSVVIKRRNKEMTLDYAVR